MLAPAIGFADSAASMARALEIDGCSLTLEQVGDVAQGGIPVRLTQDALDRVVRARALVEAEARGESAVYGVNTGFGYLANIRVDPRELTELQVNLIRSHAVGVGPPLSPEQTRALMLMRANVMATGRSGVRLETLELLLQMLNRDLLPVVPSKGSVGASGDLAPLAHVALAMLGEGDVSVGGARAPSRRALADAGLTPLDPGPKEGLCLINGTQAMGALGCLAVLAAEGLCRIADIAGAASLEGARGSMRAFDPRIHRARPHPGQQACADNLYRLLADSPIAASHRDCDRVQDAYSLRCMPQVHGATRDAVTHVRSVLEVEVNAATDNPLVFAETGEDTAILSGGNFHGQPVALALDFLAIAVAELANISDRRVEQLIDPALSGLPAFLSPNPGKNSGLMAAQITAASLVNENKVLAYPASVDSIPTSANREDHVSMGMTSARKALNIIDNTRTCLAVELMAALQAIDLVGLDPSPGVRAAYRIVRARVPTLREDRVVGRDLETLCAPGLLEEALAAAEAVVGALA